MAKLDLSPAEAIGRLGRELGLSPSDPAGALDASLRPGERWRAGETYPQRQACMRLAALIARQERLRETFTTSEAMRVWMHTPSPDLGGLRPVEAARAGRLDRVVAAVETLDSGAFI